MRPKILVVDDEPDVVELIGFNLRTRGYEVLTAHDGLEALLKARRFLPDLVVLDVMMDGMDGLSVCEILHAQPSTRAIPVIILTAATGEMAKLNSYAAGASDLFLLRFEAAFQPAAGGVGPLPYRLFLVRRGLADQAHQPLHPAFRAQILDPPGLELGGAGDGAQLVQGAASDFVDLVEDVLHGRPGSLRDADRAW